MRLFMVSAFSLLLGASSTAADWQPLYQQVDPVLQAKLEARLNATPEWARLVRNRKMAIGIVDMGGDRPRFARVNGNHMMYAASLPKIAILLAVYGLPVGLLVSGGLIEWLGFRETVAGFCLLGLLTTAFVGIRWRRTVWR